jgi:hypothetical protein
MTISPRAVAVLAELTEAFDDRDVNFRRSLTQLGDQVRLAVPSYLGVSLTMTTPRSCIQVEVMESVIASGGIRSSLMIPATAILTGGGAAGARTDQDITLILYAGVLGALVDLAADLGWLTGLAGSDFALDRHLAGPRAADVGIDGDSVINRAIGVLLSREETPQQAEKIIAARATAEGISRQAAAAAILDELSDPRPRPDPDSEPDLP